MLAGGEAAPSPLWGKQPAFQQSLPFTAGHQGVCKPFEGYKVQYSPLNFPAFAVLFCRFRVQEERLAGGRWSAPRNLVQSTGGRSGGRHTPGLQRIAATSGDSVIPGLQDHTKLA